MAGLSHAALRATSPTVRATVLPYYRVGGIAPSYWWRPGTAVAAEAALGFVMAAAATSYAGQPLAAGYCWYYTNSQRTQGFWDVCPR